MKSDGLTPYVVLPQRLHPLMWPCASEEQDCVCLVGAMPCPTHITNAMSKANHEVLLFFYTRHHTSHLVTNGASVNHSTSINMVKILTFR